MSKLRLEKIQELIKQEISNMLISDIKDPRVGFATVTRVEVAADLRHAKVYVSVMGDEEKRKQVMQGLTSALGFIRTEIAKRIRMRFAPNIHLHLDENLEYSAKINKLLEQVKKAEEETHGTE